MSVFRPSAQAMIWLRVDELAQTSPISTNRTPQQPGTAQETPYATLLRTASESSPEAQLEQIARDLAEIQGNSDVLSPEQVEVASLPLRARRDALMLALANSEDFQRPWQLLGVSPDARFARFGIAPKTASIEINGFRTADTAKITIDWKNVPFDPRIVRAAAVEIVIGVVSAEEFAAGMSGARDPLTGLSRAIIKQTAAAAGVPASYNRFVGFVDEWDIEYSDSGDEVSLSCRDLTAVFADTPLASGTGAHLDLPLDQAIQGFVDQYPALSGFPVRYVPTPGAQGTAPAAPNLGRSIPRAARPRRGRQASRVRSGDQRMNLWDYITDLCVPVGIVPVIRGYELQLINPATTFRETNSIKHMVYGRNLSKLSFARKLGGVKAPTVEVRAYDPTIGRIRWARWPVRGGERNSGVIGQGAAPPAPVRATELGPSGTRVDERIQTFILAPSTSSSTMVLAAQSIYEQAGRQEIEGKLETNDVSSWNIEADTSFPASAADLLSVSTGDAISLLVAPRDARNVESVQATAGDWIGFERAKRAAFLQTLGFSRQVAQTFAALQDSVSNTIFRVQNVSIGFDTDKGIDVSIDFANFIEVRETSAGLAPGSEAAVTPSSGAQAAAQAQAGLPGTPEATQAASQARIAATGQAAQQGALPTTPINAASTWESIEDKIQWESLLTNIVEGT